MKPERLISVSARPGARRNEVVADGAGFKVTTTTAPEDGKANTAIRDLLAGHLGVAKTRLTLVRGATARQKVFRLEE